MSLRTKIVKRCPVGHAMDLRWGSCPRCTGQTDPIEPRRGVSDATTFEAPGILDEPPPGPGRGPGDASRAVAHIEVTAGAEQGRQVEIREGSTKIGKSPRPERDAVLVTLDDAYLSRDHAIIDAREGAVELSDLGSTNGTFVNGRRIEQVLLRSGDEIRIGRTELRVHIH